MENKYYTPEIEEFCVGFEVEVNQIDSNWKSYGWEKEVIREDFNFKLASDYIGLYRVKHLDKEDIERLGWKFISEPYDKYFKLNENYSLYLEPEDKKNVRIIYTNDWGDISHPIFSGTIKNKSELRKLMQQLNINSGGK